MSLIKTPGGEFYVDDKQFAIDYEENIVTFVGDGGGGTGGNDKTFVFTQAVASNQWNIRHNLNKFPSVTVVDSGNTVVVGEIDYVDKNNVILNFGNVFSGKAYLN